MDGSEKMGVDRKMRRSTRWRSLHDSLLLELLLAMAVEGFGTRLTIVESSGCLASGLGLVRVEVGMICKLFRLQIVEFASVLLQLCAKKIQEHWFTNIRGVQLPIRNSCLAGVCSKYR
ncbi:hypothetical protein O6H91_23G060000 [Diphasiastrum complanatum]|uniref:Uncharacterized protein n=1 Tax=Diphasiastrum complanatum TaxID=34168 RepID=A0ACC2AB98_DIPCM|nr:hypothetical protein O6H91_23G060000 [Diphasiastrum complanatum]